jgi:hypothetical protein
MVSRSFSVSRTEKWEEEADREREGHGRLFFVLEIREHLSFLWYWKW